jgi:PAS domain S-box-containing protein
MLGYSEAEMRERTFADITHAEDREASVAATEGLLSGAADTFELEKRYLDKLGRAVWGLVRVRVLRDKDGAPQLLLAQVMETTQRKEAESVLKAHSDELEQIIEERTRQLRDAQDELVRKGKLAVLGQLAGGVGHELRNPLGIISNAVYYLKLVNDGADETGREYLNIISNEVRNCQKIISDLLGFARTGRADRSAVTLPALVEGVLAQIPPFRDVEVVLNIPEDLPPLWVDPGQVKQVLSNLMLNACQAMQNGGVLTVDACCEGGRIRISVTDTGCGMSEEELSRIFEPLYSTKARGIGLGLSVTKNLVEANGGRIEVGSQPGKGSTFAVSLPTQE